MTEPGLAARLSCKARATAAVCDWSRILPCWDSLLGLAGRRREQRETADL